MVDVGANPRVRPIIRGRHPSSLNCLRVELRRDGPSKPNTKVFGEVGHRGRPVQYFYYVFLVSISGSD